MMCILYLIIFVLNFLFVFRIRNKNNFEKTKHNIFECRFNIIQYDDRIIIWLYDRNYKNN